MTKRLEINVNTPVEELLELWVKHSNEMFKDREKASENLQERLEINTMLYKKGVEDLLILDMSDESYTLTYLYKGGTHTKVVPIINKM